MAGAEDDWKQNFWWLSYNLLPTSGLVFHRPSKTDILKSELLFNQFWLRNFDSQSGRTETIKTIVLNIEDTGRMTCRGLPCKGDERGLDQDHNEDSVSHNWWRRTYCSDLGGGMNDSAPTSALVLKQDLLWWLLTDIPSFQLLWSPQIWLFS